MKGQLLKVTNFHDLKKMIAEAFENIEDEIRHKVWPERISRSDFLCANNGGHVEIRQRNHLEN